MSGATVLDKDTGGLLYLLGVEPLLLHFERRQLKVAQESVTDAPWAPPWGDVLGMPHWKTCLEDPGLTGGTTSLRWIGNTKGCCWMSWWRPGASEVWVPLLRLLPQ